MKFLVDAQLPQRLARWLQSEGYQAIHTRDLPDGNRTVDATLNGISIQELCVLVTKDEDFIDTFLLRRQPYKLLLVATGNITNSDLERSKTIWSKLSKLLRNMISSSSKGQR